MQFIMKIESEVRRPITLVHMSDNGETYSYIGRTGWSLVRQGEFQEYRTATGRAITVYAIRSTSRFGSTPPNRSNYGKRA